MFKVSIDSIAYRVISDAHAIIQYCDDSITTLFPRNCLAFCGTRVRVTHLNTGGLNILAQVILVPYSIHTIFRLGYVSLSGLTSLAFEFGSELSSMALSAFPRFSAPVIFLPRSLRFIVKSPFVDRVSVTCVQFDRNSSLIQFKSEAFSSFAYLSVITIPASVRRINHSAFRDCRALRCVTFELPSECWSISSDACPDCPLLDSIFLPPSVEVIDQTISEYSKHIPRYFAPDSLHFCSGKGCLLLSNGRELIQYHGSSTTFCVNDNITTLFYGNFLGNSTLTTLTFDSE
jgi:hypothetical protein